MTTTISSSTASGTGAVTTQGIGSGLDIGGIVDKLMTIEQAPLTRLQTREAAYQTTLSQYGSVSGALSTFQSSVARLTTPNTFASLSASIADTSAAAVAIDATKSQSLVPGVHTLSVSRLAVAQRTASTAFANTTDVVGSGTITVDLGTWDTGHTTFTPNGTAGSKSITIAPGNGTLAGIRDAINAANAGVSASIVNDGTGNRLVIGGTSTGAAQGFRISTSDDDGANLDTAGLSQIAFDPAATGGTPQSTLLTDALNAQFTLDGLPVSKPDNHVTDAIAGLTIDLKTVTTASTSFNVARDTNAAAATINSFVSAYNTIATGIASLTSYDPTTKTAGALNGDATIRLISTRLQGVIASIVPTGGSTTSLGDIGIKLGADGKLTVDAAKLTATLQSDPTGVGRLFAKTGQASDSLVAYTDSTAVTQAGSRALGVTQLAARGALAGSSAAGLSITAGVNDTVDLTVDNVPTTVTLASGSYPDAASLAVALQAKINGASAMSTAGTGVTVSAAGGVLTMTSLRFGAASNVAVGTGNGVANLFGTSPTTASGVDVAGTIDGVAFTGSGQTATGSVGTPSEGLKLTIAGGALGSRGTVTFNRGIAASMNDLLTQILDPDTGVLHSATDGISKSIATLKKQEDDWTPRLAAIRARYTAQYNAMDALVASLNSTSSYLTQQITAIQSLTNGINSGK